MERILSPQKTILLSQQLQKDGEKIVIAGGCFDVLHIGHIRFFDSAKKQGTILILLLESDETVRKLKGQNRPLHTQQERAEILQSLRSIDFICMLPPMSSDSEYDKLVLQLKPAIIATTKGDLYKRHKERQAKLLQAPLFVAEYVSHKSTSKLVSLLEKEL